MRVFSSCCEDRIQNVFTGDLCGCWLPVHGVEPETTGSVSRDLVSVEAAISNKLQVRLHKTGARNMHAAARETGVSGIHSPHGRTSRSLQSQFIGGQKRQGLHAVLLQVCKHSEQRPLSHVVRINRMAFSEAGISCAFQLGMEIPPKI